MKTLHLGVVELPYANGTETTGDVATILEDKYAVMRTFYDSTGGDAVAKALEQSAKEAIESLLLGAPAASISLTAAAEGEIEAAFRIFLDQREMDNLVPGVPTKAARKGVNHRLAHPYVKSNPERASFIDTGTYQAAFKAWVD